MKSNKEIERSIIKTYRKEIWCRFVRGINEYDLIQPHDKIAVCISGGKDSFIMAKCFQELKRHRKMDFDLEFLVLNPGYKEENLNKIKENAKAMEIPIKIFDGRIFAYVETLEQSPCFICARMRRGHLYHFAKELGCNKIALGHHFDDVIETIVMGMFYGAQIQTMMPKLHSDNFEGMELIRPLYLVKEEDIKRWVKHNELDFIQCACQFSERSQSNDGTSKRAEIKRLIAHYRTINPNVDINIFRSVHDVNLSTLIGYHNDEMQYNFLDDYDKDVQ